MYPNLTEINFSSLLGNHSQIPDWLLSLEQNFRSLVFKLLEFFFLFFFLQDQNQTLSKQVAKLSLGRLQGQMISWIYITDLEDILSFLPNPTTDLLYIQSIYSKIRILVFYLIHKEMVMIH